MKTANDILSSRSSQQKWLPLLELATKEVFELMLNSELSQASSAPDPVFDITAMVGLAGAMCGVMCVRCTREGAARMASKMLGTQPPVESPDVRDGFGEVGNMIAGNFKNKITGMGDTCMLSVPTVVTGTDYSVHSMADAEAFELRQTFEGFPFLITLDIHRS